MDKNDKLKILQEVLGAPTKVGSEHLFYCPFCKHHKKKFSVNLDKGAKCWVCDWKTPNLRRLIKKIAPSSVKRKWFELDEQIDISNFEQDFLRLLSRDVDVEPETSMELPKEFQTLATTKKNISAHLARRYLKERGVSYDKITQWRIGYASEGEWAGRILVPSFSEEGKINFIVGRSYGREWPRYKLPQVEKDLIFNELFVDWTDDIILVEGVFDAFVAPNSIPLLGSSFRENSKLFNRIVREDSAIYIALDFDAEKKASKMINSLLHHGVEVYKVDTSGYEDVAVMPLSVFLDRKKSATKMNPDEYFKHAMRIT